MKRTALLGLAAMLAATPALANPGEGTFHDWLHNTVGFDHEWTLPALAVGVALAVWIVRRLAYVKDAGAGAADDIGRE
jgi:hypothetical protein